MQKCNIIFGFLSVDKNMYANNLNPYIYLYFCPQHFRKAKFSDTA